VSDAPAADVVPSTAAPEVAAPAAATGDQPAPTSTSDEPIASDLPEVPTAHVVPSTTAPETAPAAATGDESIASDLPEATESTTSVEVATSSHSPESTPRHATENEAVAERGEDKSTETQQEEASRVPAANRTDTVAKTLPPFTLSRGASKREISLLKNVRSDQIEDYQLKCFIAGVADGYELSESPITVSENSSWVELTPDPVQNDIALLTYSIRKVARRLVSSTVRITHRSGNDGYPFFEVRLNLHYRSSRRELLLVIEQVLSYPVFSELNGVTVSVPEPYYFDKFHKVYSRELTRWDTTVRNGIKKLPGEILKAQSRVNLLRTQISRASGSDVRSINARRSLISKVDAVSGTIPVLERRLINYQTAAPHFSDIKLWYAAAHDDIDYLIEHMRIDFDVERQDANGPAVTLVSTRGGN
jgi:hypothetical protein